MACGVELIIPDETICQKAHTDLMSFETHKGLRDWNAALSLLK